MDGFHYYRHELDKFDDPVEAHARRGAAFTFDSQYFVDSVAKAKDVGHGMFPDFDHATADPEQNKISFDQDIHKVVFVEGLYVLLDKQPWSDLHQKFDMTYFV